MEEYLSRWKDASHGHASYVILRLPDVLGPRDSTDRWWFYQMWTQFYPSIRRPLEISTHLRSSYIYVNDVARYLGYILSKTFLDSSTLFHNEILNIACVEIVSMHELLSLIIDELDLAALRIPIRYNPNTDADFFPSVTRGGMNISKALSKSYGWNPTPLRQVVRETVQWYNDAYSRYPTERSDMVKRIRRTLLANDEAAYGKFLFDVNQYSTESTIKRKRDGEEEKKKIVVVEPATIESDRGDHHQRDKQFKHDDM